jgi:hypothetical protein
MSNNDKDTYLEGRSYIIGLIALLFKVTNKTHDSSSAFDASESFIKEFERRNGIYPK